MTVGFVHVGPVHAEHAALMGMLIRSVRATMPAVAIVHLTDLATEAAPGVDEVCRRPVSSAVALAVLQLYAEASALAPAWLFVDTDVLVHAPVDHVFSQDFDVAVAKRDGTFRPGEADTKFMRSMPFNKGVVFSRSEPFWRDAVARLQAMKSTRRAWMGDQLAMNEAIASGRYRVRVLDARYNYPPQSKAENLSGQFVTHWKGPRKAWLLERAA